MRSLPLRVSWQKKAKDDGTVVDASSAAGGGTVRSEVSAVSISSKQLASKKERQKCPSTQVTPGIAREDARRVGATGRCRAGALPRPTFGRIIMFASVVIFSHCHSFQRKHAFIFMVLISTLQVRMAAHPAKGQPPSALFQKTCENCTVTNNLA